VSSVIGCQFASGSLSDLQDPMHWHPTSPTTCHHILYNPQIDCYDTAIEPFSINAPVTCSYLSISLSLSYTCESSERLGSFQHVLKLNYTTLLALNSTTLPNCHYTCLWFTCNLHTVLYKYVMISKRKHCIVCI